ncbi:MAG: peptidoglycan DD-metalloendopeptidase family protein [Gemmatimonadetes bacterium]|nr:peptidoglycan DD-metalloendopeptidase family protein [Gemmatimonadota bacterium]
MAHKRIITVMLVPDGEVGTHSFRVSYRWLKVGGTALAVLVVFLAIVAATWWYLAAQAARVPGLKRQVAQLESERGQVVELARRLEELESGYELVRGMLAGDTTARSSFLWLPPSGRPGDGAVQWPESGSAGLPTSWPLTVRGYVTRSLLDGASGAHPGVDIAVPADSYVRAAGAGTVIDVASDAIYGKYVLLEHAAGYRTLYGHASHTFVRRGAHVEQSEVIALTGSTGRSTAPHLHFETLKDGEPVDPFTIVRQP